MADDISNDSQADAGDATNPPNVGARKAPDPFDPESLRLTPESSANVVRKLLTTVPVGKPSKEQFVRVHPSPDFQVETKVIELKDDREIYLVARDLWPHLEVGGMLSPRLIVTAQTRQGVTFLWPIRLPGPDGKLDAWSRSAADAAEHAKRRWVRVASNQSLGAYEISEAMATNLPEPKWPEISFGEILRIGFREKHIDTLDHIVLQRLRGEV